MMKTIAVIGPPEHLGSAIAQCFAKAHYHVLLADHQAINPVPSIGSFGLFLSRNSVEAPQSGIEIVAPVREASWEADIILLATPYEAQAEVASEIKDVVTGKIVISAVNPLNGLRDGFLPDPTSSAAEQLAELLPHAKVVKAFNTIFEPGFRNPQIGGEILDVFVAGDDDEAVSIVTLLVRDAGYNPLVVGKLTASRVLESMTALLIRLAAREHTRGPIGWKVLHEMVVQDEDGHRSITGRTG